jgi:hypothetical protein
MEEGDLGLLVGDSCSIDHIFESGDICRDSISSWSSTFYYMEFGPCSGCGINFSPGVLEFGGENFIGGEGIICSS